MKRRSNSFGASLIELIVAVAMFSIVAAYCVQIFVSSTALSKQSADLSRAVLIAESVAEAYRATGDYEESARILGGKLVRVTIGSEVLSSSYDPDRSGMGDIIIDNDVIAVYYDETGSLVERGEDAAYTAVGIPGGDDKLSYCDVIVCLADGEEIYSIRVAGKEARS